MKLIDNVLAYLTQKKIEIFSTISKVLVLEFKNGDRDILSALVGTLRYQFFSEKEKDQLTEFCQEKVKDLSKAIVLIIENEPTEYIITSLKV
jgi:hypothetical protein